MSMSSGTRSKKTDSTSDAMPTTPTTEIDINTIVQKAVDAATAVLRTELTKLFENVSERVQQLETRLGDCITRVASIDIQQLEQRITSLEAALATRTTSDNNNLSEIEAVRRESRDAKMWANDNEQYMRRNNIRIIGLAAGKNDNCREIVTRFFRDKLQIADFDSSNIDAAHPVKRQTSNSNSAGNNGSSARAQTAPTILVRFSRREHRDLVIRQRRKLAGTGLVIIEDLTSLNVQTFNRARNSHLVDKTWTWNGKIFALLKSGKKIIIRPFQPVAECAEL